MCHRQLSPAREVEKKLFLCYSVWYRGGFSFARAPVGLKSSSVLPPSWTLLLYDPCFLIPASANFHGSPLTRNCTCTMRGDLWNWFYNGGGGVCVYVCCKGFLKACMWCQYEAGTEGGYPRHRSKQVSWVHRWRKRNSCVKIKSLHNMSTLAGYWLLTQLRSLTQHDLGRSFFGISSLETRYWAKTGVFLVPRAS